MNTCDRVITRRNGSSKRCNKKAVVLSRRLVGIEQTPMRLFYCHRHEKFAHVTDYKCVRIESVEKAP